MANIKISELNPLLTVEDADVLPIVDNGVTKKVTAAILQSYTQGNSVLLTGAQTVAGIKTFTSQLASTVATGTAPFSVASTTKVTNLNADLLDGLSSADFQATLSGTGIVKSTAGTISYLTDNSTNWDTAYNDKINSAAVTGSGTNTLTLTQQDAGTITATWVNGTLIREVRNSTGATLTKGTIVYISGATGNKPTVSKAIATGDSTSAQTFGFIQTDIANNANGYVVVVGDLTGIDTSAFTEGDQLYLSSTTAGEFTATKQYAPAHLVYVGIVTRSHPTLGQIEVNIQNGYEMDELHNVSAQNPSNGDILQFVTSTGLWTKVAGTTSNISEGTNLYFTNARSRGAISLTTTGTSGAATYNSTTGVLNVPNYADTDTGITSLNGLTALTQTFAVGTSGTDFGISSATSTHTFNLPTASATNRGALSSADWTTFNNKQNALTNPITGTGITNYLPKFTGASALGNSIISESGTAISVVGNSGVNDTIFKVQQAADHTAAGIQIIANNAGGAGYNFIESSTNGVGSNWKIWGGAAANNLVIATGGTDRLTIASTGAATFSSSVTATQFTADSRTKVGGGYIADMGGAGNDTGIFFGANTILPSNGSGTITTKDLGSATYPWGAATFSGGVTSTLTNASGITSNLILENFISTNPGSGNGVAIDFKLNNSGNPSALMGKISLVNTFYRSNSDMIFSTALSDTLGEKMRITAAGNLGLGATSGFGNVSGTETTLHIANSNVASLYLNSTTGIKWALYASASGRFAFSNLTDSIVPLTINPTGNIGVNTSVDAGYKLDVNGTARFAGDVTYDAASSNSNIVLKRSASFDASIYFLNSSTFQWQINTDTSNNLNFYKFQGGTGNALSIASTGAATFSSSVTANGNVNIKTSTAYSDLNIGDGSATSGITIRATSGSTPVTIPTKGLQLHTGYGVSFISSYNSVDALSSLYFNASLFDFIGGPIAISNSVTSAASVASTHKVQIVINGTTYYLLATT